MDFLKSAVASAIAKGSSFPYVFEDKVDNGASFWTLHNGYKKSTIKFINEDASSIHGAIRVSSIYTSESGEWKIAGFDILSSLKEDDATIYTYGSLIPDHARYAPPEVIKGGWDVVRGQPLTAVDAYGFGTLIFEIFNGSFTGNEQAGQTTKIAPSMQSSYKRLMNPNPKLRLSIANFLEQGKRSGGFFQTPLIKLTQDVESLGLKNDEERDEFISGLDEIADDIPEDFFKMRILPELLKSLEFGGGGPKVLSTILSVGTKLSDDEYSRKLTPAIIRLFANPDRAIRVCLLDNLPLMVDRLSQKIINNDIFPQMLTGFTDIVPVVREQTVKAVLPIISKLSDRTINGELLRYLAKTANDEQPGIRTNTTICLGKIAKNLSQGSRTKVLAAAFSRSLKDPFVHARHAGLLALAATIDVFPEEDCATKILPVICPALVDKEKLVRDQANKAVELYLQRIRKYSAGMAETVLPPSATAEISPAKNIRVNSPNGASSSWAGWAFSSFSNISSGATGAIEPAAQPSAPATPPVTVNKQSPAAKPAASRPKPAPAQSQSQAARNIGVDLLEDASNEEDAFISWGAMDDNGFDDVEPDSGKEDTFFDAVQVSDPVPASRQTQHLEDQGEPDFAGWLAAQSKAKSGKPLPKGLSKSSATSRPGITSKSSKPVTTQKPKPVSQPKKINTKPKESMDTEGWGDAWD
ncbi:hypothetical protein FQN57_007419 [Myotisia sp. PD_48]|nr:hypothetical protein FQN57_007419 [Myotisia sp. PD_48]